MPINRAIQYIYLAGAVFFQLYLAYASTLYFEWTSVSFFIVAMTGLISVVSISYYILIAYKLDNHEKFK